jgi:hypothetical protein
MLNRLVRKVQILLSNPVPLTAIVFWALALLPIAAYIVLIARFGMNVPFNDEWETVTLYRSMQEGTFSVLSLWAPHNEHRSILFYWLFLVLARLSGFNSLAPLLPASLFKILTLLMVYDLFRITLRNHPRIIPLLTLFAAVFMFSAQEGEVLTWGFASLYFNLGAMFAVMVVWALTRYPASWRGTVLALAASLGGSLTIANGVLFWGVGLACLALYNVSQRRHVLDRYGLAWLLAMAVFLFIYFRDYHALSGASEMSWILSNKRTTVLYFLSYMASLTVYYGQRAALPLFMGTAGLVLFATVVPILFARSDAWRHTLGYLFPWLLLSAYVLGVAAITTYGRAHFGVWQAQSSRYVTLSYPFWLSLLVLATLLVDELLARARFMSHTWRTFLTWTITPMLIMVPIYFAYAGAVRHVLPFWHDRLVIGRTLLYRYQSGLSQGLSYTWNGNIEDMLPWLEFLDQNDLGPFAPRERPSTQFMAVTFPVSTVDDLIITPADNDSWRAVDLEPVDGLPLHWSVVGPKPSFVLVDTDDLCLADYQYVRYEASLPASFRARWFQMLFRLNGAESYDASRATRIPYLADGDLHAYSFDLRLLEYPAGSKITGILIKPVSDLAVENTEDRGDFTLRDLRLIPSSASPATQCVESSSQAP